MAMRYAGTKVMSQGSREEYVFNIYVVIDIICYL